MGRSEECAQELDLCFIFHRVVACTTDAVQQVSVIWEGKEGVGVVVYWLLNIPATCKGILGTDLLRQFYMLPH